MTITTIQSQVQSLETGWESMTPGQVASQLMDTGTALGAPTTATVPGTNLTFGDLNQVQQLAFQYASAFGTGGVSMQNFLSENSGPDASWNLSYNQIQANPQIAADAQAANFAAAHQYDTAL